MNRASLLALALLASGCGARSDVEVGALSTSASSSSSSGGPAAPPAHIYATDSTAGTVVRVDDMSGAGWTSWSTGTGSGVCGVALDAQDRIHVATAFPPGVVRIDDMSGAGLTVFTGPPADPLGDPFGVALDGQGRIYVADAVLHRIVRFDDMSGAGWVTLGGPDAGSGVGQFSMPEGIAVAPDGKILVADTMNQRIVYMDDISGAGWKERSLGPGSFPYGVSFDRRGHVYAVDFELSSLHHYRTIDDAEDEVFTPTAQPPAQMSHVFVHDSDRIFLGMLNGAPRIAAMDDMEGTGFVTLDGAGAPGGPFQNPCGVFAR